MEIFPLLAAVSWNSWCVLLFPHWMAQYGAGCPAQKKLWCINVTWLPESSRDGIIFLPHPMFILGHVAMALSITFILTWAETCWLDIFSINPTIPLSVFVLSISSGPQTSPSDWSKVWGAIMFLLLEASYLVCIGLSWCCHLLLSQFMCNLIVQPDTVIFDMPSVLTIETGHTKLQCPIGTMCQLGLPRPAYVAWSPLILSAPWWCQVTLHGHSADCFSHGLSHFFQAEQAF